MSSQLVSNPNDHEMVMHFSMEGTKVSCELRGVIDEAAASLVSDGFQG